MESEIEGILRSIAEDLTHGATSLASRALDALERLSAVLSGGEEEMAERVRDLVSRVDGLRPSMGAIGTQAVLAVARAERLAADGLPWSQALSEAVRQERETLDRADAIISESARTILGEGGVLVSCSWSATATRTIMALEPDLVRVGHGHPLGDGLRAASWLAARGLKVEIVADAALPAAVEGARAAIVGADQVLADGSIVNRCSTFSLALAARYHGAPFHVVCQRIKLGGQDRARIEEMAGAFENLPPGVSARVPLFDVTPPDLVTGVTTESGTMSAREAGDIGRSIARLRRRILETRGGISGRSS